MELYLISFKAEYYCQGWDIGDFTMLVKALSYEKACDKIKRHKTNKWEVNTPTNFTNLTINT